MCMCVMQDVTAADQDMKAKLYSVEQHLGQLAAQLSDAENSVSSSDATAREAHSRAELLKKELGEARSVITTLELSVNMQSAQMQADAQIMLPNPVQASMVSRNSILQEVWPIWNIATT